MEQNTNVVCSEKIMQDLKRELMEEEEKELPSFDEVQYLGGFKQSLEYIQNNNQLTLGWSFGPIGLVTFIKKAIRKVMKCVLVPLVTHQNMLNYRFAKCMNMLQYVYDENVMLKKEIADLKEKQLEQETMLRALLDKQTNQV